MKKITFEKAVNEYLIISKINLKPNSYRSMENRILNNILPYFFKKRIQKITKKDYLDWQQMINKKNYSIAYKKNLHICFSTFLNYCIKYYDLKENVARKVGNFKEKNYEIKGNIWTIEEFNQFIQIVDNPIYKVLFDLLFFTGVRLGEALALKFEDLYNNKIIINKSITRFIDNNGNKIISSPKTKNSIRTIGIDDILKKEIDDLKNYYKKKYANFNENLFIFGGEKPLASTTIERKKNHYCDSSNVKRIKIHEFRHSHACMLFQNQVPIDEISNRLGHSSISITTDIYLRFLVKQETHVLSTINTIRALH